MDLDKQIGARLQRYREKASIKPETAAIVVDLSVAQYLECERGVRRLKALQLVRLCRLLEISVLSLFQD